MEVETDDKLRGLAWASRNVLCTEEWLFVIGFASLMKQLAGFSQYFFFLPYIVGLYIQHENDLFLHMSIKYCSSLYSLLCLSKTYKKSRT